MHSQDATQHMIPTSTPTSAPTYTFTLTYQLAEADRAVDVLTHRLSQRCFAEVRIQIGRDGRLSLTYVCPVDAAQACMRQLLFAFQAAVPSATFLSWVRRDGTCLP